MKAYTSIEQSKKLAKILPIKSADMHYLILGTKEEPKHIVGLGKYTGILPSTPCWSLAALLDVIPVTAEYKGMFIRLRIDKGFIGHNEYAMWYDDLQTNLCTDIEVEADNPVDACYKMIIKLHEQKVL